MVNKSKISGELVERDEKGKFVRGHKKIGGKELGNKHFNTLMDEMVREIAKERKISEVEVWGILIRKGYSEAESGNYLYYRDLLDRYYGKPKENLDITTQGEKIQGINYITPNASRKNNNN